MSPVTTPRSLVLIGLLLICTILAFYMGLLLRISIVYTHFFYVPIVLGGLWYPRKTLLPALYLGFLHLGVEYVSTGGLEFSVIARAGSFVLVAALVGLVAGRIRRDDRVSLQYLSSYAERVSTPRARILSTFDGVRMSLGLNMDVERMRGQGDLAGLLRTLDHTNPEVRYQAVDALGTLGDPAAAERLAQALRDPDCGVRWKAAEALGRLGSPALPFLLHAIHDSSADIRWRATLTLGSSGEKDAIPALINILTDADRYVRGRAIVALAGFGEDVVDPLARAAENEDPLIRSGAIRAFGLRGDPGLKVLVGILERTPGEELLSSLEDAFFDQGARAVAPLLEILRNVKDAPVRALVCRVLGRLGDVETLPLIAQVRDHDEDEGVRTEAAITIERLSTLAGRKSK
ncbi:MAG: HEAT repeat domain-containing protein [Methanomicrobiales archaeon]|nr:HEAT repeat domain-containing protein [Methanomicrobiales archaeon]